MRESGRLHNLTYATGANLLGITYAYPKCAFRLVHRAATQPRTKLSDCANPIRQPESNRSRCLMILVGPQTKILANHDLTVMSAPSCFEVPCMIP